MSDTIEISAAEFATTIPGLELLPESPESVEAQVESFTDYVAEELWNDIKAQGYAQIIVPLNGGFPLSEIAVEKLKELGATNDQIKVILASKDPIVEAAKKFLPIDPLTDEIITNPRKFGGIDEKKVIEGLRQQGFSEPEITVLLNRTEIIPGQYYLDGEVLNGIARIVDDISDTQAAEKGIREAVKLENKTTKVVMHACSRKETTPALEYGDDKAKIVKGWITAGYLMNGGVIELNSTNRDEVAKINTLERFCRYLIRTGSDFGDGNALNTPAAKAVYKAFLQANAMRRFVSNGYLDITQTPQFQVQWAMEKATKRSEKFYIARERVIFHWLGFEEA